MRAYIAGPMRGYPEFNFPAFFECDQWMSRNAPVTALFNPAQEDASNGFPWRESDGSDDYLRRVAFDLQGALRKDIKWIVEMADTIVMLPGWSKSTGARLEKSVAEMVGCDVLYYWPDATPRLIEHPRPEDVEEDEPKLDLSFLDAPPLSVAEEAARTVGERAAAYGAPTEDFGRTASLFYYASGEKHALSPEEVALFQICVKLSRRVTSPKKRDHMVDTAGYADCYWRVVEDTDA